MNRADVVLPEDVGQKRRNGRKAASILIANPVAMPRLSGNHFTSVLTGEMYPSPHPIPPISPIPIQTTTDWCSNMPMPPITSPQPKKHAAAVAAVRGPRRSTHGPIKAALNPSNTSAVVNVV
jgi:hypothetical protein